LTTDDCVTRPYKAGEIRTCDDALPLSKTWAGPAPVRR
jgi:hypothetical protein